MSNLEYYHLFSAFMTIVVFVQPSCRAKHFMLSLFMRFKFIPLSHEEMTNEHLLIPTVLMEVNVVRLVLLCLHMPS